MSDSNIEKMLRRNENKNAISRNEFLSLAGFQKKKKTRKCFLFFTFFLDALPCRRRRRRYKKKMPTPNPTFPLSRGGSSSSSRSDSSSSSASTSSSSSSSSSSDSPSHYYLFKTPAEVSEFVRSLSKKELAVAAAAVVAAPLAVGGAWWLFERSFNSVTPYQVRGC